MQCLGPIEVSHYKLYKESKTLRVVSIRLLQYAQVMPGLWLKRMDICTYLFAGHGGTVRVVGAEVASWDEGTGAFLR